MSRKTGVLVLIVVVFLFAVGCSKAVPKLDGGVPVKGIFTYKDALMDGVAITFHPEGEGKTASAYTGLDGTFTATTQNSGDGMMPGTYIVTVVKTQVGPAMSENEREVYAAKNGGEYPAEKIEYLTDKKFSNPKTTDIKVTISANGEKNLKISVE